MVDFRVDFYRLFCSGFAEQVLTFPLSLKAVVIVPPPRSVVRSSAQAPLIFAKSDDVIVVRNVCAVAER